MNAHNMAEHRGTRESPEVLLHGRRRRYGIPMIDSTLVEKETEMVRERDTEYKNRLKDRKNVKRRAKETTLQPGDLVYMKRVTRTKGQAPFDPNKFEIVSIARGDCVIRSPDGTEYKRSVIQLKKAPGKRKIDQNKEQIERENGSDNEQAYEPRPKRTRREPKHLSDYVHRLEQE